MIFVMILMMTHGIRWCPLFLYKNTISMLHFRLLKEFVSRLRRRFLSDPLSYTYSRIVPIWCRLLRISGTDRRAYRPKCRVNLSNLLGTCFGRWGKQAFPPAWIYENKKSNWKKMEIHQTLKPKMKIPNKRYYILKILGFKLTVIASGI
jgi:hypothetical protein